MKGTTFIAFIGFYCLVLYSYTNAAVSTSISLRPELSNDDTEIWEVYGVGDYYESSYDNVYRKMIRKASEKSNAEGYDCFRVLDRKDKTHTTTNPIPHKKEKKTIHGSANSYYGGTTHFSYDVPVEEKTRSSPASSWYVVFHTDDECMELENTKWRTRIYYNDEVIKEDREYTINEGKFALILLLVGGLIALVVGVAAH
jgi:hypothetical protein